LTHTECVTPHENLDRLLALALGGASQHVLDSLSCHGPEHWARVAQKGARLASETPGADVEVVLSFAVTHDSQRADEWADPLHGQRAAEFVRRLHEDGLLRLTDAQVGTLAYACAMHTGGEPTPDPTVGVCYDSDRLDLARVGIEPDPKFMSTPAARAMSSKETP
jgi:uncharacterized protein